MSAIVCGKRSSSYFEELHHHHQASSPTSPSSASKKIRCSSSPTRFLTPRVPASVDGDCAALLAHLREVFPDMEQQLLEKALEASDNDLDLAIESLNGLRIGPAASPAGASGIITGSCVEGFVANDGNLVHGNFSAMENLQAGSGWVELFVGEMSKATDMDDARTRASQMLELFAKDIGARANTEAAQSFQQENLMLKHRVQELLHDNNILKRAVAIQHERQKEFDEKNHEIQNLKQLASQYQERVKTLEVNNYALTLHLKQAQQNNSIPGRFHPDVF